MKYKHLQGFSLIEVLVAISLLLVIAVGPMQLIRQSTNSTQYANEQAVAYFLAQEGIELVQKRRDELLLEHFRGSFAVPPQSSNDPIASLLTTGEWGRCAAPNFCGLEINSTGQLLTPTACGTTGCRLYLSSDTPPRYTYTSTGNTITRYTRRIQITAMSQVNNRIPEFRVTSTVRWRTGSLIAGQQVELETYLANIYDLP